MIFNSVAFLIFFPLVFFVYWFGLCKKRKLQNIFLLLASYIFYGWWDWRFLSLIIFSSLVDYFVGLRLSSTESQDKRKLLLYLSLFCNLGMLGIFKYYNFFIDTLIQVFSHIGINLHVTTLSIILPVGISFYTFQTLSYTVDIYRRQLEPTKSLVDFLAFVSFFPQLVAGPIERAKHLLPQFANARIFDYQIAVDGTKQIIWGFFKKIVIADNLAASVDYIYSNHTSMSGSMLAYGTILFAFQIYSDFSGYSDIAIGLGKLLGFDLMNNFSMPYFSRNIIEFWRRWHISLSTWFRDYVYIPLGGSKVTKGRQYLNSFITFLVSGLWHGANWTYVIWGGLHGFYYIFYAILGVEKNPSETIFKKFTSKLKETILILTNFLLVSFAWIFFRSDNLDQAISIIAKIFSSSIYYPVSSQKAYLPILILFILVEWLQRKKEHVLKLDQIPYYLRYPIYIITVLFILVFMAGSDKSFIYFQF